MRRVVGLVLLCTAALLASEPRVDINLTKSEFYLGERIPITLSFHSGEGLTCVISSKWTDVRRSQYDHVLVDGIEIQHAINPVPAFYDPRVTAISLGYIVAISKLVSPDETAPEPEPVRDLLLLNQLVRFKQPGTYTITVRSSRMRKKCGPDNFLDGQENNVTVLSNPVTIKLLPLTQLQDKEIVNSFERQLKTPGSPGSGLDALRGLAALDSPESSAVLLRCFISRLCSMPEDELRFAILEASGTEGLLTDKTFWPPATEDSKVAALRRDLELVQQNRNIH